MNLLKTTQQREIESRIFTIREVQVMLDRDLAELYGVETKVLNQAVKRNIDRFPIEFRFQLSENEMAELVANSEKYGHMGENSRSQIVTLKKIDEAKTSNIWLMVLQSRV